MDSHYAEDEDSSFNDSYDYGHEHTVCDKRALRSFAAVFLPVVYAVALVVGLAGNALVAAAYASRARPRTLTDVCVLHLAVSDLLLLLTLPLWAADAVRGWRLGPAACKLTSFVYGANFSCGMLLLACISVDRYRAAAHNPSGGTAAGPRAKRRWVSVCVALWVAAGVLGLPDLIFSEVKRSHHGTACTAVYPAGMARPVKAALELLEVTLRFLLPLLVMVACYGYTGRVLSRAAGVQRERRWRALRVLLAVVAVFLLTQTPYNVVKFCRAMDVTYALVTDCGVSRRLDGALRVTEALALTHACVNPVLYASIGSSFRGHVLRAARRLGKRLGRRRGHGGDEPAAEIALRPWTGTRSQSGSEEQETGTFTI